MSFSLPLTTSNQQTQNLLQGTLLSSGSSSSSYSTLPQQGQCTIYIGAEPTLHHEKEQATACLTRSGMHFQENDPDSASHYLLFITDSFLKSKDRLLPLINHLKHDPHFKQRLFAIVMDENIKKHIYPAGGEDPYVQYWTNELTTIGLQSSQYGEVEMIRDNIAIFIQTLRVTLMPNSLDELLKDDMAMVTDVIKKRTYLLEKKRFFSLPLSSANVFSGREVPIADLSSKLLGKSVARVTGEKGMGKTALAVEYAKRSEVYPTGIFWLDASNQQTLDESFQNLGIQLGTNPDHAKRELHQMKDFLLIYDNVTDPTLIPQINAGHAIIIGPNLENPDIILERFSADEAERYVLQQIKATPEEARELCNLLEYHPAKLTEAISYIKRIKISIRGYLDSGRVNPLKKRLDVAVRAPLAMTADLDIVEPSQQYLNTYNQKSIHALFQGLKDQDIQIFVSYNWGAFDDVNKIDKLFEDNGIKVLRDTREARPFESLRKFMKKVVRVADYTFSIISAKYLKSFNCLYEIITTMKDPNWKSRVFPIILPRTILDDAAIQSYKQHWLQEADRIEKEGGSTSEIAIAREGADKIVTYLEFVNQVQPAALDVQLNSKFQDTIVHMLARQEKLEKKGLYKQDIFHLPMGRNTLFTGREKELRQLENSLNQGTFSAITNTGMGGVGKTQLALEYAYKNESKYKMIYWIRAEDLDTLKSDLLMLGSDMEITEEFLKEDKLIPTMKAELEKREGWLLVFDNAKSAEELAGIMPQRGGHVIVTSRDPNWKQTIKIDVYSPEEALSYLQKILGVTGQDEELRQLAKDLGYLPLALTQAGAYIKRQQIDVATYREEYKKRQKELLSQKEKGYPDSVATTWLISIEKIQQEDPNATKLLNFCSYLAPDNIPSELLEAWLNAKNGEEVGLGFHDALAVLESYSMIDQKVAMDGTYRKLISIHRLIQAVTRDECESEEVSKTIELGVNVLNRQFKGNAGTKEEREAGEALVEHAKAMVSCAKEQKQLNENMGHLASIVGIFLGKMDKLEEAKRMHELADYIYTDCLSTENIEEYFINSADNYNNLGTVLTDQGELTEAKVMHERALELTIKTMGTENHIIVARTYNKLGRVLRALGDLTKSKEMHERAFKICTNCLDTENHIVLAESYNHLGLVLHALDDLSQAKAMYEKALEIYITCLGTENHTSVAISYSNLANVLQGDLARAKVMHEKAIEIKIACLGTENHTSVAISYTNLGNVLKNQKSLAQAKVMHEKAITIFKACLGTENHTHVASCYNKLGSVLKAQRDLAGAKEMYVKAITIFIACLGTENHIRVADTYYNLGVVLKAQNDLAGAKEMLDKGLKIRIFCLGPNHSSLALAANYTVLGNVLKDQRDFTQAKAMYEKGLQVYIAHLGTENHLNVISCYLDLGDICLLLKQKEQAREYYLKAKKNSKHTDLKIEDAFFDQKILACDDRKNNDSHSGLINGVVDERTRLLQKSVTGPNRSGRSHRNSNSCCTII